MWRPRDRERYIGGYDPEHEMPDPDRDRGGRWQSDAYRHNARDSRFVYRWDPDRFERQFGPRDRGFEPREWDRDGRDRGYIRFGGEFDRGYDRGYDPGMDRGYRDEYSSRGRYDRGPYDRGDYDRGGYEGFGPRYDRNVGFDRGWDTDRGFNSQRGVYGSDYDRGGYREERDPDRYRDEGWDQSRYDRDRWRR